MERKENPRRSESRPSETFLTSLKDACPSEFNASMLSFDACLPNFEYSSIFYPPSKPKITIFDPQVRVNTFSKHILYSIQGEDSSGTFRTFRRYKEFFQFRKCLTDQWPGSNIPQLPPKKAIVFEI